MGGLFGIGGSGAETDRGRFLGSVQRLGELGRKAEGYADETFGPGVKAAGEGLDIMTDLGLGTIGEGKKTLGRAKDYWSGILSGSRSDVNAAVAPEANQLLAGEDAMRRDASTFGTARGGGVNELMQQRQQQKMKQIDDFIFGARPMAAEQTQDIAQTEAAIGGQEAAIGSDVAQQGQALISQALQAMGLSSSAADSVARQSLEAWMKGPYGGRQFGSFLGDLVTGDFLG